MFFLELAADQPFIFFRHSTVSAASGFCSGPSRLCLRRLRKAVAVDAPLRAPVGLPCSQLICLDSSKRIRQIVRQA